VRQVAASDDGDVGGLGCGFDAVPVVVAAIQLGARACVDEDGCQSALLGNVDDFCDDVVVGVEAFSDFEGDGACRCLADGHDGRGDVLGALQEECAAAVRDDGGVGAGAVEVDEIGAHGFGQLGSFGELFWVCPDDLGAEALFVRVSLEQRAVLFSAFGDIVGNGHFANGGFGAEFGDEAAKGAIGDVCHRAHEDAGLDEIVFHGVFWDGQVDGCRVLKFLRMHACEN